MIGRLLYNWLRYDGLLKYDFFGSFLFFFAAIFLHHVLLCQYLDLRLYLWHRGLFVLRCPHISSERWLTSRLSFKVILIFVTRGRADDHKFSSVDHNCLRTVLVGIGKRWYWRSLLRIWLLLQLLLRYLRLRSIWFSTRMVRWNVRFWNCWILFSISRWRKSSHKSYRISYRVSKRYFLLRFFDLIRLLLLRNHLKRTLRIGLYIKNCLVFDVFCLNDSYLLGYSCFLFLYNFRRRLQTWKI